MALIKNGSPQFIALGADDQSKGVVTPSAEPIPQHCPLFYIFAKKGPTGRLLLSGSKLTTIYGSETFDLNDKYYNHQTRFLQAVSGQANTCMVQRLVPPDSGVNSNAAIYIDMLEADIPNYLRDKYGSYVTDPSTGEYKVDTNKPTIPGYKVKFIREVQDKDFTAGSLKPKTGTMSYTRTYVPEIQDAYDLILNNVRNRIKVGDTLPIYNTVTTRDGEIFFNITSSNTNCVAYDNESKTWKGIAAGTSKITITLSKLSSSDKSALTSNRLQFDITVTSNDVKAYPSLTVTGIKTVLTSTDRSMTLDISGTNINGSTATITVNNSQIATVSNRTITGVSNGVTYVSVNVPATTTHEGMSCIFTVQSKVIEPASVTEERTSKMYPILEFKAKYPGEYYNNLGFAITSLFEDDVDTKIVSSLKALPYKLAIYTRSSSGSSPTVLRSLYGDPSVQFSFVEKAVNPNTEGRFDFETVVKEQWYNETDELKTLRYNDFESMYLYRTYLEDVLKKILENEKNYVSEVEEEWSDGEMAASASWFDFTTDDDGEIDKEYHLINPFVCKSSKNVNYFTLVKSDVISNLASNQREVAITSDSPIFLDGGSDGTISNDIFESLVVQKMAEYVDNDSEVQDLAINVESIFYDSGFSLATKKELVNFISLRKDTVVVLSTHDDSLGEKDLSLSDARAVGVALKARYQLAPESDYYGTPVCRGIVFVGTGLLRDGSTSNRIPFTYELAVKAARMMGASNGKWDATEIFDNYPGNVLEYLIDPSPAFIPAGIKPTLWNEGLVWIQPYDRSSYHIPALQTVYDDDTSSLNNFFTVMCIAQLVKSGDRVWRKFTGTATMTDAEFIEAVSSYAMSDINNAFAGILTVTVDVEITEEDEQRGYSWRMYHNVYAPSMKTVMVYSSRVYRSSDLES